MTSTSRVEPSGILEYRGTVSLKLTDQGDQLQEKSVANLTAAMMASENPLPLKPMVHQRSCWPYKQDAAQIFSAMDE